jgi:hypothetical protein
MADFFDGTSISRRTVMQLTGAAVALPITPSDSKPVENWRMSFTPKFVDLVRNTTTTVGTIDFALGPAVMGYTSFTVAVSIGDSFYYSCIGIDKPNEREVGRGTLQANGTISRDPIGGVKTNFSMGNKTVALIAAAEWYSQVQAGAGIASRGALASARGQGAALLCETGREGLFVWDSSNRAASVAADPAQAMFIPPTSDPSGASGAWVRKYSGSLSVKWFGALGDGTTDDSAAFVNAIAYLKATRTQPNSGYGSGSAQLFIPAGQYHLGTTTLDITHTLRICGESTYGGGGATELSWAAGTTGIRIQSSNTSGATAAIAPAPSDITSGQGTIIEGLQLKGNYAGTESEAHGIHLRANATIRDCAIYNFPGDGIHSVATAGGGTGTEGNDNTCRFENILVQNCRNGIFFDGADTNACTIYAANLLANRQWGVWDSSFLGNTYTGCQADSNGAIAGSHPPSWISYSGNRYAVKRGQETAASTNPPSGTSADNSWWYFAQPGGPEPSINCPSWTSGATYRAGGSYCTDDTGNAGVVLTGCYIEGGQPYAQMVGPTLVVGGSMSPRVKGVPCLMGSANYIASTDGLQCNGSVQALGAAHEFGPQYGTADLTFNLNSSSTEVGFWAYVLGVFKGYIRNINGRWYLNGPFGVRLRDNANEALDVGGGTVTFMTGYNPTLTEVAAASIATPAAGTQTLFIDTADHKLKRKDSSGAVTVIA